MVKNNKYGLSQFRTHWPAATIGGQGCDNGEVEGVFNFTDIKAFQKVPAGNRRLQLWSFKDGNTVVLQERMLSTVYAEFVKVT